MNYVAHLLVYFEIYTVVALSLNLLVGYCGILSLAHAAYFAVGGYAYALVSLQLGWGFGPALVVGCAVAGALSLAISLPSWRLKGDFLVLATLAVQALLFSVIYNWSDPTKPVGSWNNLTNGPFGISSIPKPELFGASVLGFLVLSTIVTFLVAVLVWRLTDSPWGRLLTCMRDDELATRSLGKNTRVLKVQVLAVSCALAALAGALYAAHLSYLDPSAASLDESILMLSVVLVGGAGNFRGPLVGACVLIALPEFLRFLMLPDDIAANLRLAIYGILLVLMMHFRPQGLCGLYRLT